MNRIRPLHIVLVVGFLALAAGAGAFFGGSLANRNGGDPPGAERSPAIGGPFRLVDQKGTAVDERLLKGKLSAVFFGYTYCPDVCPTTLTALGRATDLLGADASKVQVVFITVDPERDSPAALATYLASPTFPKGVIGLTGSPARIAEVAKAYHVYYRKAVQGSSYTVDHSAVIYLMDRDGRFLKPLDPTATPPELARQIREALAGA